MMPQTLLDWRTITDEREKYAAYLCSPEWGRLRRIVAERSKGKCERCLVGVLAHTHHLTYIRKYNEEPEDLQGVCQGCHDFIHGRSPIDPARCQRSRWMRELESETDHEKQRELIRKLTTG